MLKLSPNFSLEELTTTDVHDLPNSPSQEVVNTLRTTASLMEEVRTFLGNHAIHVNSGYRSPEVNARVGGVANSAHVLGFAVDFLCPAFGSPMDICRAIVSSGSIHFDQLIQEGTWTHISFDPRMRNQVLTKGPNGTYLRGLP